MTLAKNIEFLRNLPKMPQNLGLDGAAWGLGHRGDTGVLAETVDFGSNPGDLRMFSFVPRDLQPKAAMVVVLHGCTQTAADYDVGAGWSRLAARYGFVLLMPQQKSSNNANGCFNWFNPEDTRRNSGEAFSIRQMVEHVAEHQRIDRKRIFVTGLSAGGAMTSAMLATYPEVFAAGAVIAGLPYGIASNVQQALSGMFRSTPRPGEELGDLVRDASKYKGPWPKVSVWHGSADRTVNPANADEIVKQWLDVHQLPASPMSEATVDGYPRQVWWNADGETVVESYTITNMAHGTPLGVADNDERYGSEGAFLIEAGISSSYHIASFFGLTGHFRQSIDLPASVPVEPRILASGPTIRAAGDRRAEQRQPPGRRAIDISAVITRALTAAGLMK